MPLKTIIATAAPLAVASVLLVGATSGASAYQCKSQPQGVVAAAVNYPTAVALGQSLWTSKVKSQFGLEWSVWTIAASPTQSCSQIGAGFQCVVTAKPCKYVVQ
jgi:hypothetical protein